MEGEIVIDTETNEQARQDALDYIATRCLHDGQPHATKDCPCKSVSSGREHLV